MNTTTIFRVYYMTPAFFPNGWGKPTTDLAATHVYLKDVVLPGGEAQLERVYHDMQGEIWSPNGEARGLIEQRGLGHTSMSVGDVIVVNGTPHVVATFGFKELPREVLRNVPDERGVLAGEPVSTTVLCSDDGDGTFNVYVSSTDAELMDAGQQTFEGERRRQRAEAYAARLAREYGVSWETNY